MSHYSFGWKQSPEKRQMWSNFCVEAWRWCARSPPRPHGSAFVWDQLASASLTPFPTKRAVRLISQDRLPLRLWLKLLSSSRSLPASRKSTYSWLSFPRSEVAHLCAFVSWKGGGAEDHAAPGLLLIFAGSRWNTRSGPRPQNPYILSGIVSLESHLLKNEG